MQQFLQLRTMDERNHIVLQYCRTGKHVLSSLCTQELTARKPILACVSQLLYLHVGLHVHLKLTNRFANRTAALLHRHANPGACETATLRTGEG
jgi:hypothetical protein